MNSDSIIEEKITFDSNGLLLTGVVTYPQTADPVRSVLLCSPHPHFAGNMDNNVITELSQYLARDSVTLRFDYRGIGDSEIQLPDGLSVFDYWDDIEESKSYDDAVSDVASAGKELFRLTGNLPQVVIGYSFGAATAFIYAMSTDIVEKILGIAPPLSKVDFSFLTDCVKPALVLIGKEDFLYSEDNVELFKKSISTTVKIQMLDGCDHFFRGDERLAAEIAYGYISTDS